MLRVIDELFRYGLIEYCRLLRVRRRYHKSCRLFSSDIRGAVQLGRNVSIAENVSVRSNVNIGDYSYCSKNTILFNNTTIGKYCSIGYNVQIGPPEHPTDYISTSPRVYRDMCNYKWPKDDYLDPVRIGNDVWIGSDVVILQGCTIGDGAIIAAGSVVTKDVPSFSIVAGVPAKLIKKRFDAETERVISELKWWELSPDRIVESANKYFKENKT